MPSPDPSLSNGKTYQPTKKITTIKSTTSDSDKKMLSGASMRDYLVRKNLSHLMPGFSKKDMLNIQKNTKTPLQLISTKWSKMIGKL